MIVVAGEALIDLIVAADDSLTASPGGGPFNLSRAIARLDGAVSFLGRVSGDRFGTMLRDRLRDDGVGLDLVVGTDEPTTLAVAEIGVVGSATYRFYTAGTSAAGLRPDALPRLPDGVLAIHVGTLGLVLEPLAMAMEALVERADPDALVMLDLNARPAAMADRGVWAARVDRLLARVDVMSGSVEDLAVLRPDRPAEATAAAVLQRGVRVVLLTDGARPARIVTRRGTTMIEPPRIEVVDTVGAGDSFGGGFLATWVGAGRGRGPALDDDEALRAAVGRALRVAALNCTRRGADPPTTVELAAAYPTG